MNTIWVSICYMYYEPQKVRKPITQKSYHVAETCFATFAKKSYDVTETSFVTFAKKSYHVAGTSVQFPPKKSPPRGTTFIKP